MCKTCSLELKIHGGHIINAWVKRCSLELKNMMVTTLIYGLNVAV